MDAEYEGRAEEDDWMEGDDEEVVVDIKEDMGGNVDVDVTAASVSQDERDDGGRVKVDDEEDTGTGRS